MPKSIATTLTLALSLSGVLPAHARDLLARRCVAELHGDSAGTASYDARMIAPVSTGKPFAREIDAVGLVVGVDSYLLRIVVAKESSGDPNAVSHDDAGNPIAYGLMQVRPSTFEALRPHVECLLGRRADIRRPLDNLTAGALLYRQHLDATGGDVEEAAKRYHGGLNPAQHGPRTRAYARGVATRYRLLTGPCRVPLDDWA